MEPTALETASCAATRGLRASHAFAACAGFCGVAVLALIAVRGLDRSLAAMDHMPGMFLDFDLYREQARLLVAPGIELHPLWLYPPLSAAVVLGFTSLTRAHAHAVWAVLQLLWCAWLISACTRQLPSLPRGLRALAAFGLTAASFPVLHCVKWGQLSLFLLMISVIAFEYNGKAGAWLMGAAGGLKLYPLCYTLPFIARAELHFMWRVALSVFVFGLCIPCALLGPLVTVVMWARVTRFAQGESVGLYSLGHQTLPALIARWVPPGWICSTLTMLSACGLLVLCIYHGRKLPLNHPLHYTAVILTITLIMRPGWVHYYVVLPLALAVLLEHARERTLPMTCCIASFVCSAGALFAVLFDPGSYEAVIRAGLVTWAGVFALAGLWSCKPTVPLTALQNAPA